MLKIIIADDEKAIRESISKCINWKSLGLELIGTYKNGAEAYDAILNDSPDIIMTDIQMPGMSGLEIIERITSTAPDTQFIILSGYSEFSYAQTAMKHGVRHYLLKPCSEEQIISSLKDAIQECYKQRSIKQLTDRQKSISHSLQRSIFMNMICEAAFRTDSNNEAIYEPYRKHLDFDLTSYRMITMNGLKQEALRECYNTIWKFHQSEAPSFPMHCIYAGETLLFFYEDYPRRMEIIQHFEKGLIEKEYVTAIVGKTFPKLSELMDHVLKFSRSYGTVSYVTPMQLIPIKNYSNIWKEITSTSLSICQLPDPDSPENAAARRQYADQILKLLGTVESPIFLNQMIAHVLYTLSDHDCCCSYLEATEKMVELRKHTDNRKIIRNFSEWFLAKLETSRKDTPGTHSKLIQDIKNYVEENLSNPDLTLKLIAENYLFMNVDYVSKCFFKESGVKFSAYLRELRIQKAKELLASDDSSKLQNVAEYIGLGNSPQYFSQIFKKSTGMTPSAYSKMLHGK